MRWRRERLPVNNPESLPSDMFVDNEMTVSETVPRVPFAADIPALGIVASSNGDAASAQSVSNFVRTLFRLLDESPVRYCVLHSWDQLPDHLPSDLDLAIDPDDKPAVPAIWNHCAEWLHPLSLENYATKGHSFYFFWTARATPYTVAVDIIFEHRRAGMIPRVRRKISGLSHPAARFLDCRTGN